MGGMRGGGGVLVGWGQEEEGSETAGIGVMVVFVFVVVGWLVWGVGRVEMGCGRGGEGRV